MDLMKLAAALGMPQDVGSRVLQQAITRKAMGIGQESPNPQSVFDEQFGAFQKEQQLKRMLERLDVPYTPLQAVKPEVKPEVKPVISNEPDARASEMERMRQQYGAGASFWNTDEGKDLLLDTMSNQYTGDQAGLPGFYQDQMKAGLGQLDMIKKSLGYEEGSAMAKWADANPALALREYNKRQPNAYAGTGPSDEEIKAAMDAGNFFPSEGSPNPLGKTGEARESNTAQTKSIQNAKEQAIKNESLNALEALRSHNVPDLYGMDTLFKTANKLYGGF